MNGELYTLDEVQTARLLIMVLGVSRGGKVYNGLAANPSQLLRKLTSPFFAFTERWILPPLCCIRMSDNVQESIRGTSQGTPWQDTWWDGSTMSLEIIA